MAPQTDCNNSARHARHVLLCVGLVAELLMGGSIFGWNALSVVLKDVGVFEGACEGGIETSCPKQDAKLATIWTSGVFAVNFGPALSGLFLDWAGPRVVSAAGAALAGGGVTIMGTPSLISTCRLQVPLRNV
jgi:hypothetical protein